MINEFSLSDLWNAIKSRRKLIFINCAASAIVAVVIGYSIPKQYKAEASIASESNEEQLGGSMGALASMAGLNLNGGTDAISPDLYPDVISTNDFIVKMLYINVTTVNGETMTCEQYLRNKSKKPWWAFVTKSIKDLRRKLFPPTVHNFSKGGKDGRINPKYLSEEDDLLIESLRKSISCTVGNDNGVIYLTVTTQDPLVSTQAVDSVMSHLQTFITDYRTSKARTDLEHFRELEREAAVKYDKAKKKYAAYCDTHQELALQAYMSEQESLENEMQLAYNVLSQMKTQVQMQEAKVQEKTPAFTILQASVVPTMPYAPRKMLILLGFLFVTFCGTVAWIYLKLLYSKPQAE